MPLVLADRVQETTTTTGTGAYSLAGAKTGFQSFAVVGNGNTTYYAIFGGSDWEVGLGTYTSSGTTLSRDSILSSSNSNNAVNWPAGTKDIFITYPAGRSAYVEGAVLRVTNNAILGVENGGTGASSLTGIVKGTGTSAFTAGNVNLASEVTGTLPVANGGTGATTLTGVLKGNGTGAVTASNVNLASEVTGTLPVANGGTGITALGTGVATFLGTPSSANLATAVTDETGSGALVFANTPTLVTPVLGTPTSGNLQNCTADGTTTVGFKGIPVNSQSTAYTLVLGDAGKTILHPSTDNNARTFTIPANGSVAYPVGTSITFINLVNTLSIAITTDTMVLASAGSTGTRTLAANGVATCVKTTSTTWIISGNGLT